MSNAVQVTKRTRGPNFNDNDKDLLIELAIKYKNVIENKKTDGVTVAEKNRAWDEIAIEYNSSSEIKRTALQLKSTYNTYKKSLKNNQSNLKVKRKITGGGPLDARELTSTEERLSAILGHALKPLPNPFDSDAEYNKESTTTCEIFGDAIVEDEATTTSTHENTCQVLVLHSPSTSTSTSTFTSAEQSPSGDDVPTTSNSNKDSWKNWARRRRPSQQNNQLLEQKLEAARNIGNLAASKKKYYDDLLTMNKEAKQTDDEIKKQKLEMLKLQTQYYKKKLGQNDNNDD